MLCPSCNQEANILVQEPDVDSLTLKGTTVTITVNEPQFCDKCSATVRETRFWGTVEVPEAGSHQGAGHDLTLHPEGLSGDEGEFRVDFRLTCSCGLNIRHTGTVVELTDSTPAAPWL